MNERRLFGGRMYLPERDVRKGGYFQVTLLCLVEGLLDGGGGLLGKGSDNEGEASEERSR